MGEGTGGVEATVEGVSVVVGGVSFDSPSGVGTREMLAGVPVADGRGLFFERGREEGADKKSSGMSFHCSVALGSGVGIVLEGTRFAGIRGGADTDLGGGGGRFGAAEAGRGGGETCVFALLAAGFLSHPAKEDCSMFGSGVRAAVVQTIWRKMEIQEVTIQREMIAACKRTCV